MATETIELHLPETLYRRLERLAQLSRRPLESVIMQALSSSIPPFPDHLAPAQDESTTLREQPGEAGSEL